MEDRQERQNVRQHRGKKAKLQTSRQAGRKTDRKKNREKDRMVSSTEARRQKCRQ